MELILWDRLQSLHMLQSTQKSQKQENILGFTRIVQLKPFHLPLLVRKGALEGAHKWISRGLLFI